MMKKLMALTLCMLLVSGVALAGTATLEVRELGENKTLVMALPEGVDGAEITDVYEMKLITFELGDKTKPHYVMTVSHSEVLDGKDITDLSDEELGQIVAYTASDSLEHAYEVIEMEDGWPGLLVHYEGDDDWVDALTLIEGYIIQVHGYYEDFAQITEEDHIFAFTLLDAIDIVNMEE